MKKRLSALLLAAALLLTSCGGGNEATATTMRLQKTQGTVGVSDGGGTSVEPREGLGLYSGYGVGTERSSYAWVDLDEVKLTKLDENSEIEIKKEGKQLEIEVKSGSLFFNVTEPLADDETLDIRSSTMVVGIRGTCGWVRVDEDRMTLYLLKGKVECTAGESAATVTAGEVAVMTEDGEIAVRPLDTDEIPAFVQAELDGDDTPDAPDAPDAGPENDAQDREALLELLRPAVENLDLPLTVDGITYGVSELEAAKSAYLSLPYALTNPMYSVEEEIDTDALEGREFDIDAVYACYGMNDMPVPEGYHMGEFAYMFSAPYTGGPIDVITVSYPGFRCLGGLEVGDSAQTALALFGFPDSPPQAELEWVLNNGGTLAYEPYDEDSFGFAYEIDGVYVYIDVVGGRVRIINFDKNPRNRGEAPTANISEE